MSCNTSLLAPSLSLANLIEMSNMGRYFTECARACVCERRGLQRRTCGTLLELFIFLFPPLPRLEDPPQGGQLAVAADGRSVDPGYQATGSQHPLLVHQLYCSKAGRPERRGLKVAKQDEIR